MENPAEAHANRLRWNMGSWSSIELRVKEDFENKARQKDSEFSAYRNEIHYIETAIGRRMYERILRPGSGGTINTIEYSDGERAARLVRREDKNTEQVSMKRIFGMEDSGQTLRPGPLKYLYVGLEPLPKAIREATYLGTNRFLGRDCDLFHFTEVRNNQSTLDFVYWLDQSTSVPLRVEFYKDEAARLDDRPRYVWRVGAIKEFEGHHLAVEYTSVNYLASSPKPDRVRYRIEGRVESVHFDRT